MHNIHGNVIEGTHTSTLGGIQICTPQQEKPYQPVGFLGRLKFWFELGDRILFSETERRRRDDGTWEVRVAPR